MTILINILGAPSTGKTSLSAKLFAELKALSLDVEYPSEFIKGWAWEGREISPFDQYYVFGKEVHNQSKFFNKAEIVISDAPVMLTAFYHCFYNKLNSLSEASRDFYKVATEERNVKVLNFFLMRRKEYNPNGRYQTQEESDYIAQILRTWLNLEGYNYIDLNCPDEERLQIILNKLKQMKVIK